MNAFNCLTYKRDKQLSLLILLVIFYCCTSTAQFSEKETVVSIGKIRAVTNSVLKDASFQFVDENTGKVYKSKDNAPKGAKLKPASAYNDWRYWNGVLNIAMLYLSEVLQDTAYKNFAVKNVAYGFETYQYFQNKYKGENKWAYPFGQFFIMEELDDCGAIGASVIEVYKLDKQKRYKEYIDKSANHIMNIQTRLEDRTFVRSFPYKWTLWADDLYMGLSFLVRMGELTGDLKYFDDAAHQVIQFHKYLFDDRMELMHHCWYSDVSRRNVAYWGRANGWAILAQIDLLDKIPANHFMRDTLLMLFQKHILGIAQYQGPNGLWHQLLDKADSYYETSCSAIFTYAVARAVNKGYLESRYASIARRGWEGVMSKIREDGQIEGVCTGTVVSNDLVYYYNRPAPLNDVHGIGFVILAGAEIIQLNR